MIKLSIIVSGFNQQDVVAQTLESVLEQSAAEWECIVVNDNSTDQSETVIQQYAKKDTASRIESFIQACSILNPLSDSSPRGSFTITQKKYRGRVRALQTDGAINHSG